MAHRYNRLIGILSAAAVTGGCLRLITGPSVEDLEQQAAAAWHAGDVSQAEKLARRALGASNRSEQAREVLHLVAAHDADVLLKVAVLRSVPTASPRAQRELFAAGDIAFQAGFAAVAERQWHELLERMPTHSGAFDRLLALAGMRLDRVGLFALLEQRSELLPTNLHTIRLLLTAESLDQECKNLRSTLQSYVAHDSSDFMSMLGLARCLIADGQPELALQLLETHPSPAEARLLKAHALLLLERHGEASSELSKTAPVTSEAEYWFVRGLIAEASRQTREACDSFSKAVALRPLNREFRAMYCRALRAAGDEQGNAEHAEVLHAIQRIELIAKDPATVWDTGQIDELITLCQMADASFASGQLVTFRNSLHE